MPFSSPTPPVCVTWEDPAPLQEAAQALAQRLALPLLFPHEPPSSPLLLVYTAQGLELRDLAAPRELPVRVELVQGKTAFRLRSQGREPILRAVGGKAGTRPSVLDATAGLGGDALVLAAAGCRVDLVERAPVVAALLADGLARAAQRGEAPFLAGGNLALAVMDARDFMIQSLVRGARHDVVCLDPMYPAERGSALPRKEMRRLRRVAGEDDDAPAVLETALGYARQRVVVKRPLRAPPLGGRTPHHTLEGSSTRFDIYLPSGL